MRARGVALIVIFAVAAAVVVMPGGNGERPAQAWASEAPGTTVDGTAGPAEALVALPQQLRAPALSLPSDVLEALRDGRWEDAHGGLGAMDARRMVAPMRADHAFVTAWTAVRAGRAAGAVPLLPAVDAAPTPPRGYVALARAELLRAADRGVDALAALDEVKEVAVAARAAVLRAEVLHDLGRTSEASRVYEHLVDRADPAEGSALALLVLAKRRGPGTDAAYPLLRRLWAWYPATPEGREASALLAATAGREPTADEILTRATRRLDDGASSEVIELTAPLLQTVEPGSPQHCRAVWLHGRALYKKNELTKSLGVFGDAGRRCADVDGGEGHRVLYTQGQAQQRLGRLDEAAAAYRAIPDLYTHTSYADDGLTRAGVALYEAGDVAGAQALWQRALAEFPVGDTVPEATFRLAFSLYDEGRPDEARRAALALAALPASADEVHVVAGRYWAARWLAYPDVRAPSRLTADREAVREAVAAWADLVRDHPHGWYGALAWSRLRELAPEGAQALASRERVRGAAQASWRVHPERLQDGPLLRGVALARLGLVREALSEWDAVDLDALSGEEFAWIVELRAAAGDWLAAHALMHRWLRSHPLGTHGEREVDIVRVAYPDRYWTEVQAAAVGASYSPRMLHALVREESMFDHAVVSFAGARGLAQLMPATADSVARKLGLRISRSDLFVPETNLRLGARYLDDMLASKGGNPALALASYNAGPGNVDKWLREKGNLPLDEFVERIPFRETRGYVKRVTSSWQTMRYVLDADDPPFVDLSAFNHRVRPDWEDG